MIMTTVQLQLGALGGNRRQVFNEESDLSSLFIIPGEMWRAKFVNQFKRLVCQAERYIVRAYQYSEVNISSLSFDEHLNHFLPPYPIVLFVSFACTVFRSTCLS